MLPNTIYKHSMADGSVLDFSLNWKGIYLLESINKEVYDGYMQISAHGIKSEKDIANGLYAAYCCANAESGEVMSFLDFLDILPVSRNECYDFLAQVMNVKKK